MDVITKLIKSEIKKQYKSVHKFSKSSGIPYSTLANALTKGIGGTSYDTVTKIFKLLNLKDKTDCSESIFGNQFDELSVMFAALDDHAVQTVKDVLCSEFERCSGTLSKNNSDKSYKIKNAGIFVAEEEFA